MATYLPGITDYIPKIQPFKPDLNYYANILQTKEAQYQAGYDKLSNIYGTLLNSEMLRSGNIERRDDFFTKIDNDIKKVSGMDLSKEQNVMAAQKIFQPLIDDKYIQKDIAFTKNWRGQQSRAEALKNCTDPKKCGGQWWEDGVRALNYQAEDFTKATDGESLSFANPTYTPYVNTWQKAMDFAKEMGYNVKTVTYSPDGMYRINTTNGPQIVEDLTKMFINQTLSDPQALDMYKTKAYLNRKDYVRGYSQQFGSEEAAERNYINDIINKSKETQSKQAAQAEKQIDGITEDRTIAEKSLTKFPLNETADANYIEYLESLDGNEQAASSVVASSKDALMQIEGLENMDIQTMRYRADLAEAQNLLVDQMYGAATDYAMGTMEQEIEEDKYALASFNHGLQMKEIEYRAAIDYEMEQLKFDNQKQLKLYEYALENGGLPGSESALNFDEQGMPVEPGAGGTGIPEGGAVAFAEQQVKAKMDGYNQATQNKMQFVVSQLDAIINNPNAYSKEEVSRAKKYKEELYGKAEITSNIGEIKAQQSVGDAGNLTQAVVGAAATDIAITTAASLATAGAGASATGIGAPIGLALLGAAGVTMAAKGIYDFFTENNEGEEAAVVTSQGGYIDASGKMVDVKGHTDATNPKSPYNITNINKRLDAFIATEGNGLFRGNENFKKRASQLNQEIEKADAMQQSAFKKARKDNLNIRQRMIGLYGGNDGSELLVDDSGHKLSREEFYQAYAQKYNPDLLRRETQGYGEALTPALTTATAWGLAATAAGSFTGPGAPLVGALGFGAGLIANAFIDDMDDIYDKADERYNRIYNNGEVSGLGIGINSIGEGGGLVGRGNRVFEFDPAQPGPLKAAVKEMYLKDIAPALSNRSMKGATFAFGDASSFTNQDQIGDDAEAASVISNLMRQSLGTKWKKTNNNRPVFQVTRVGITQNNPDKVAVTFEVNEDFINKYDGSDKNPGITAKMSQSGDNKVSVLFDRNKVNSLFFKSIEPSNEEFLLYNNGRLDVNAYNEFGGAGSITRDPISGMKSFTINQKYVNPETGRLEQVTMSDVGDFDVTDMYEKINQELATRYQQNYNTLRTPAEEQTNE